MTQSKPPAEVRTTGRGGKSAAHGDTVWLGSGLQLAAGNNYQQTGDGSNLTTDEDTVIVGADTSSSALTVTLDSASASEQGRVIIVTDEGGNAATNAITVDTEGSETIDGSTSATISTGNGQLRVYSNGSNWFTF